MSDQLTLESITPEIVEDDGSLSAPENDPLFKGHLEGGDTKEPVEEQEDVINILEPRDEHAEIHLHYNGQGATYIQKPLTYFGKMEFMNLVGRTLDEAMKGEDGLRINSLFETTPTDVSELSSKDFADLDSFLGLVSKIARYAPEFLKESYLIWLSVPKKERAWAREALDNLEDEQGIEIVERFIDQNWEALESFFGVQIGRLFKRVADRRKKD